MNKSMKSLQLFYAAALSDAAYHYGSHEIMDEVTAEKKTMQELAAASQLKQLSIDDLESVYTKFKEIFGCADWHVKKEGKTITAETSKCMLCAIAKKQGSCQPCKPFCINPFAAYAKSLGYELNVRETLWDGGTCVFENIPQQ